MIAGQLTRTEREELAGIVKRNYRVARNGIDEQRARVLANFEAALSHQWEPIELACAELLREAEAGIARVNRRIGDQFAALGLPQEWAPRASAYWADRGSNAASARRAELRRSAVTRADAQARKAKLDLERREAETLTALASTALTSEAAKAFLRSIPSPDQLMPPLELEPGPPLEAVSALLGRRTALSAKRAAAGRAGGRASTAKQVAAEREQIASEGQA
jgi:hypothetical protein